MSQVGNADELLSAQLGLRHCKNAAIAFAAGSLSGVLGLGAAPLLLAALMLLFTAFMEGAQGYLCCLNVSNQTGRRFMLVSAFSALGATGSFVWLILNCFTSSDETLALIGAVFTVCSVMAVALFLMFLLRLATVVASPNLTGKAFILMGLFMMTLGATTAKSGFWVALLPGLLGCLYLVVVLGGLEKALQSID